MPTSVHRLQPAAAGGAGLEPERLQLAGDVRAGPARRRGWPGPRPSSRSSARKRTWARRRVGRDHGRGGFLRRREGHRPPAVGIRRNDARTSVQPGFAFLWIVSLRSKVENQPAAMVDCRCDHEQCRSHVAQRHAHRGGRSRRSLPHGLRGRPSRRAPRARGRGRRLPSRPHPVTRVQYARYLATGAAAAPPWWNDAEFAHPDHRWWASPGSRRRRTRVALRDRGGAWRCPPKRSGSARRGAASTRRPRLGESRAPRRGAGGSAARALAGRTRDSQRLRPVRHGHHRPRVVPRLVRPETLASDEPSAHRRGGPAGAVRGATACAGRPPPPAAACLRGSATCRLRLPRAEGDQTLMSAARVTPDHRASPCRRASCSIRTNRPRSSSTRRTSSWPRMAL